MKKVLLGVIFLVISNSVFADDHGRDTLSFFNYHTNIQLDEKLDINHFGFSTLEYMRDLNNIELGIGLEAPAYGFESFKKHQLFLLASIAHKTLNIDDHTVSMGVKFGAGTNVDIDSDSRIKGILLQVAPFASYKYHIGLDLDIVSGLFLEVAGSIPFVHDIDKKSLDIAQSFKGLNLGIGAGVSF